MIAEVRFSCGRHYLSVAGICVAVECDPCRESNLPLDVLPPIPEIEMEHGTIGGKPIKELPLELVHSIRGNAWDEKMLKYVCEKINLAAKGD